MWRVALAGVAAALFAVAADAREVRVPLRLDYPFLRELLVHAAFSDPEQTARVYTDGVDCKHVVLSNPELRGVDGKLRVLADVDAKVGTLFVGICLFPIQWRGRIESNLEPSVDPAAPVVHFRVLDSRLLEPDGSPSSATTAAVWEWLKGYVHPRLERFGVDLAAPMADLRAILPLFLAPASADRAEELVASLALERVAIEPGGCSTCASTRPSAACRRQRRCPSRSSAPRRSRVSTRRSATGTASSPPW